MRLCNPRKNNISGSKIVAGNFLWPFKSPGGHFLLVSLFNKMHWREKSIIPQTLRKEDNQMRSIVLKGFQINDRVPNKVRISLIVAVPNQSEVIATVCSSLTWITSFPTDCLCRFVKKINTCRHYVVHFSIIDHFCNNLLCALFNSWLAFAWKWGWCWTCFDKNLTTFHL